VSATLSGQRLRDLGACGSPLSPLRYLGWRADRASVLLCFRQFIRKGGSHSCDPRSSMNLFAYFLIVILLMRVRRSYTYAFLYVYCYRRFGFVICPSRARNNPPGIIPFLGITSDTGSG
jgi:hypothetical protein